MQPLSGDLNTKAPKFMRFWRKSLPSTAERVRFPSRPTTCRWRRRPSAFFGTGVGGRGGSHMLQLGQRLGDFEVIRQLGKGGMGEVYEAQQFAPPRRVALKVLAPH